MYLIDRKNFKRPKRSNICEIISTLQLAQRKHTKMAACVVTKGDIGHVEGMEGGDTFPEEAQQGRQLSQLGLNQSCCAGPACKRIIHG